ncbi:MAG: Lipid II flippase FtsW [Syntrophorhabdus sp. PtaU1.Bin153]|nr:MAG: Lipid II flippase FtsW [Syntrophorhabdus sp. PtaU1.Bin153]
MIGKIVTAAYLTMMAGLFFAICRRPLTMVSQEVQVRRIGFMLCAAYMMGICFLFIKVYVFGNLACFALLLLFCPFVWAVLTFCRTANYAGPLNILLLALLLSSIGIVVQYRLNLPAPGLLARIIGAKAVPSAANHFLFSITSLTFVCLLLFSGKLSRAIDWVEENTSAIFWGILSSGLLLLPFLLGSPVGGTRSWILSGSVQTSELVLKVTFVAFIAAFLSSKAHVVALKACPQGELIKIILSLVLITGVFFVLPMAFLQRELGTTLLLAITLVVMITLTTGRLWFLPLGIGLIASAIALACLIHPRTAERIVAGWLEWREYAFRPYSAPSRWPGYQAFLARAAFSGAGIWGRGISEGYPRVVPEVSSDFVAVAIIEEMGVLGLLLVIAPFVVFLKEILVTSTRPDFRGCLRAGIAVVLATQALYNLGGVLNIIPLTGVPLPFISTGGTAIYSSYLMVAIMSCLSNRTVKEEAI